MEFKRDNKNRPREMSSKKTVGQMVPRKQMSTNADYYRWADSERWFKWQRRREGTQGSFIVTYVSIRLPKVPLLLSVSFAEKIMASLLRFDPLCGEFNDKLFKESYQFVNEVKSRELVELKKQLKTEEDKERREEVDKNEKQRLHNAHICNVSKLFPVFKYSLLLS